MENGVSGAEKITGGGGLVSVLTPFPVESGFDYRAPEGMALAPGDFVEVEVGRNRAPGLVLGPGAGDAPAAKVKPVLARADLAPMGAPMRAFLARAAEYTLTPQGLMFRLATRAPEILRPPREEVIWRAGEPPEKMTPQRERVFEVLREAGVALSAPEIASLAGVSAGVVKGLAEAGALLAESRAREKPFDEPDHDAPSMTLSEGQAAAASRLCEMVGSGAYHAALLRGVTGSGKTEVYLEAVAACLKAGRQALILLPEIALTASFVERVERRFGARPAQWHSGVSGAERRRVWRGAAGGGGEAFRRRALLAFSALSETRADHRR